MQKQQLVPVARSDRVLSYFAQEKGVLAVVTVSGLFYNVGMGAGPYFEGQLAQCLYDVIEGVATAADMLRLALLFVIAFVQAMRAVKRYAVRIFANDISRSMRHILYHALVHLTGRELEKEQTGTLMTKAIADVDTCAEGMRKFTTEVFDTGVVMAVYLVMLLSYDVRLTVCALVFTPLAYVIAGKLKKTVAGANLRYKESQSALNRLTMDRVANAVTYRIFGREEERNEAYEAALTDYEKKSARANVLESSFAPIYDAIAMIGAAVILYYGAQNIIGTGWTTWDIASFTTYLACFTKLATKASHAAKLFNAVQKAQVSWGRIKPLMRHASEVADEPIGEAGPVGLSFEKVGCGEADAPLFKNVTFSAQPGEIIGITGCVASGKSQLGKILIGEVPYTGSVRLGGRELSSLRGRELFSLVGYMGHEPELMSASIAENVALGDAVDVERWLSAVALTADVRQMPEGAATLVGAGGRQLSGGSSHGSPSRGRLPMRDPYSSSTTRFPRSTRGRRGRSWRTSGGCCRGMSSSSSRTASVTFPSSTACFSSRAARQRSAHTQI